MRKCRSLHVFCCTKCRQKVDKGIVSYTDKVTESDSTVIEPPPHLKPRQLHLCISLFIQFTFFPFHTSIRKRMGDNKIKTYENFVF
jgi:hypothetical protein